GGLLHGARFFLSIVVVLLLYRFVPARGLRIRDGFAGGDRHRHPLPADLARLRLDQREDDEAQRRLRLAHSRARLSLLHVSVLVCPAARCRGSRGLVAAGDRGWRTDPDPTPAWRPGTLRSTARGVGQGDDARPNP